MSTAVSNDLCFTDAGAKSYCYYDKGTGTWSYGDTLCRSLGGHLPIIWLADKQNFLKLNFKPAYWISLKTDSSMYDFI